MLGQVAVRECGLETESSGRTGGSPEVCVRMVFPPGRDGGDSPGLISVAPISSPMEECYKNAKYWVFSARPECEIIRGVRHTPIMKHVRLRLCGSSAIPAALGFRITAAGSGCLRRRV